MTNKRLSNRIEFGTIEWMTREQKKGRQKEVVRLMCEIENPFPPNSLIDNYRDFIGVRDRLHHFQFNQFVFEAIINLAIETWCSEKRINRLSLLTTIKRYGFRRSGGPATNSYSKEVNHKLFKLYRNCIESAHYIPKNQLSEAIRLCNYMLINAVLPDTDVKWMLNNYHLDSRMLNRILRYPEKNELISQWIEEHFKEDELCIRRAEATSWLLDYDPEFIFDKDLLLFDLQRTNTIDKERINEYESSIALFEVLADSNSNQKSDKLLIGMTEYPTLDLVKRPYAMQGDNTGPHSNFIPDFEKVFTDYEAELDYNFNATMMWAIAYSRLDKQTKTELLKRHYTSETYAPLVKIASRYRLLGVLEWLHENLDQDEI